MVVHELEILSETPGERVTAVLDFEVFIFWINVDVEASSSRARPFSGVQVFELFVAALKF